MQHAFALLLPARPDDDATGAPVRPASPASARDLRARIRRYNAGVDPASQTFSAALVLLAGAEWSQNIDQLARRLGLERAFVARCARRLIDNGVWSGGRTVADWTPDGAASGTFWNDVAVAEGKLCRRAREDGSPEWAPAGYWNKSFHFVDPEADSRLGNLYLDSLAAPDAAGPPPEPATDPAPDEEAAPATVSRADSEPIPFPVRNAGPADDGQDAPATDGDGQPGPTRPIPSLHHIFRDAVWIG